MLSTSFGRSTLPHDADVLRQVELLCKTLVQGTDDQRRCGKELAAVAHTEARGPMVTRHRVAHHRTAYANIRERPASSFSLAVRRKSRLFDERDRVRQSVAQATVPDTE